MILWCSIRPYFKSFYVITVNTSVLLYGRHSISKWFQRTTWKFYKVIKEPLLFGIKKLFPASYPELTTQGYLLHAMSLGSPGSKRGKLFLWFVPAHTSDQQQTSVAERLTNVEILCYNLYLKYFAFFVWLCCTGLVALKMGDALYLQLGLICHFFPFTAIHRCAKWEYKALLNQNFHSSGTFYRYKETKTNQTNKKNTTQRKPVPSVLMNTKNFSVLFHNSTFIIGTDKDVTVLLEQISATNVNFSLFCFLSLLWCK